MDTADGVLSSRSRERMLEIMKDSRSGAMGVIACVLLLLLKWTLLVSLMELGLWNGWVIVPFIWSRVTMVLALASKPQARPEEGLGGYFLGVKAGHVTIAYLLGFALASWPSQHRARQMPDRAWACSRDWDSRLRMPSS